MVRGKNSFVKSRMQLYGGDVTQKTRGRIRLGIESGSQRQFRPLGCHAGSGGDGKFTAACSQQQMKSVYRKKRSNEL